MVFIKIKRTHQLNIREKFQGLNIMLNVRTPRKASMIFENLQWAVASKTNRKLFTNKKYLHLTTLAQKPRSKMTHRKIVQIPISQQGFMSPGYIIVNFTSWLKNHELSFPIQKANQVVDRRSSTCWLCQTDVQSVWLIWDIPCMIVKQLVIYIINTRITVQKTIYMKMKYYNQKR